MEKWRMEKWRSGEVEKWRRWRSGEVEKWRSGENTSIIKALIISECSMFEAITRLY